MSVFIVEILRGKSETIMSKTEKICYYVILSKKIVVFLLAGCLSLA